MTPSISYSNPLIFQQSIPQAQTPPGGGPSWAYLPYLPLESKARERRNESQAKQAFMHVCVCSNQPIPPLIIVQSSNLSLYYMFALLHCAFTMTRDKQFTCCMRSKQDLYVYTLFLNSFFFIPPRRKRGMSTFIIYCVSRHFLTITDILLYSDSFCLFRRPIRMRSGAPLFSACKSWNLKSPVMK